MSAGLLSAPMLVRGVETDSRCVDVVASTDALDSHGTILEQKWDLSRYLQNPVVLWSHNANSAQPPIGFAENVRVEGGALRARVHFVDERASALAEQVWNGVRQKSIRGLSVGFRSRTTRAERRGDRDVVVLTDNELFEISFVAVPSNVETLTQLRSRALHGFTAAQPQKAQAMTLTPEECDVARAMGISEADALTFKTDAAAEDERRREIASLTDEQRKMLAQMPNLSIADVRDA